MKKVFPVFLSALWLMLVIFLSLQNGSGTGELSTAITKWLIDQLQHIGVKLKFAQFHTLLRVAAHFIVFFVMGLLFSWTMNAWLKVQLKHVFSAFAAVSLIAVLVEVGKLWIPGRHLQWNEVLLNVIGAWCGVIIWHAVGFTIRLIRLNLLHKS